MEPEREIAIGDDVVTLRWFTLDDGADVTAACQDEEIIRWTDTIPSPYTESIARSWISGHDDLRRNGTAFHFAIVDQADSRLGGAISVEDLGAVPGSAIVGYWVAPWARGRGLAGRALNLLSDWAFRTLALEQLYLTTMVGNVASERVAAKGGFVVVEELIHDETEAHRLRWMRAATVRPDR